MAVKYYGKQIAIYFHSPLMLVKIKYIPIWNYCGLFTTDNILDSIRFNSKDTFDLPIVFIYEE